MYDYHSKEENTRPSLPFHYISKMMVMIHTPNMPMTMFPAGVDFTNILRAAFTHLDPKRSKMTVKLSVSFALLGSTVVKTARKLVGEIYTSCSNIIISAFFIPKIRRNVANVFSVVQICIGGADGAIAQPSKTGVIRQGRGPPS